MKKVKNFHGTAFANEQPHTLRTKGDWAAKRTSLSVTIPTSVPALVSKLNLQCQKEPFSSTGKRCTEFLIIESRTSSSVELGCIETLAEIISMH